MGRRVGFSCKARRSRRSQQMNRRNNFGKPEGSLGYTLAPCRQMPHKVSPWADKRLKDVCPLPGLRQSMAQQHVAFAFIQCIISRRGVPLWPLQAAPQALAEQGKPRKQGKEAAGSQGKMLCWQGKEAALLQSPVTVVSSSVVGLSSSKSTILDSRR